MLKNRTRIITLFVIACGVALFLYQKYRVAPDLTLIELEIYNLDGARVDMNQYKGKAIFVTYWATWCGECLQEMPSIETAYHQVDTNSVVFLMVSDDSPEKIASYLSKHNYPMQFVRLDKRLQEIGINTIPTTYLFDKNGNEIFNHVGSLDWSDPGLVQMIQNVSR